MRARYAFVPVRTVAAVLFLTAAASARIAPATSPLPDKLSDAEYWKLVGDISEPDDFFRIVDNFTSNEPEVGQVSSYLRAQGHTGGVYIGVGPEQNLSYIAAVRPRMAFICDIRRQAMLQHLMYKAMFEMSKDRADFISMLFGLPRPAAVDTNTPIQDMWTAFQRVGRDTALSSANYKRVIDRLLTTHKFSFTPEERGKFDKVFRAFQDYGPNITTQSGGGGPGGGGRGGMNSRTFEDLTGFALDTAGNVQSFLSTEDNYRFVKGLHEKNLIVGVSGDFGKTHALKAIGAYVKDHDAVVKAFYVSNVEQYLFMDQHETQFYENVATFPIDSTSVFIRPYSMRGRGGRGFVSGSVSETPTLCPIGRFLKAVAAGRVANNNSALACPVD